MEFSEKKTQMLYRNDLGGRIMVRIMLPSLEENCDFKRFYEALTEKYLESAKGFVLKNCDAACYFFDVSYECDNTDKCFKIKRISTLKVNGRVLKKAIIKDCFTKNEFRLKK